MSILIYVVSSQRNIHMIMSSCLLVEYRRYIYSFLSSVSLCQFNKYHLIEKVLCVSTSLLFHTIGIGLYL